jgi:superfamily I DNA/RNA helicase
LLEKYLTSKNNKDISIEDERRLFYVGATRAKKHLIMTYAGNTPKFIKEMKIYE